MSEIRTELDRIISQVEEGHSKATAKGGTPQSSKTLANLLTAIDTIPEATEPKLQAKTATPSETAQTVKPDSGYDGLSQVSVGAISKTYVGSSVPKQAAQTITPGTANKTIASGRYLTGAQTIKGDSNLKAENIKSGVSIFGVAGTMTAGEDVTAETNAYTSLLDDLEAAVYALPDAGGGGASVETCTVEILANGPTMTTTFQFIDADGAVQHVECSSSDMLYGVELVVQGNSPLTSDTNISSVLQPEGGAVRLNPYCYYIMGDATVYIGG